MELEPGGAQGDEVELPSVAKVGMAAVDEFLVVLGALAGLLRKLLGEIVLAEALKHQVDCGRRLDGVVALAIER